VTDRIRFHFDPLCPFAYQTSRWVRRLAELGELEVDWAVFSLAIVNEGNEESEKKGHSRGGPALRTVIAVREAEGAQGVERFYAAIGRRIHELHQPPEELATIRGALEDAGLDPALAEKALGDNATWEQVRAEHAHLVENTRSFGVPTIVLDGGEGPAIFGPVISKVPTDEDAVELWRHVAWLTRYDNFAELKRERTVPLDLPRRP
jgi:2-hydroxychromene-2-carboxylate isomerase